MKSLKDNKLIAKKSKDSYVKGVIDKVKTWKKVDFPEKRQTLSDAWLAETTASLNIKYKFAIRLNDHFQVHISSQLEKELRECLKRLSEQIVAVEKNEDFNDSKIVLNPIFIWLTRENGRSLNNV